MYAANALKLTSLSEEKSSFSLAISGKRVLLFDVEQKLK